MGKEEGDEPGEADDVAEGGGHVPGLDVAAGAGDVPVVSEGVEHWARAAYVRCGGRGEGAPGEGVGV